MIKKYPWLAHHILKLITIFTSCSLCFACPSSCSEHSTAPLTSFPKNPRSALFIESSGAGTLRYLGYTDRELFFEWQRPPSEKPPILIVEDQEGAELPSSSARFTMHLADSIPIDKNTCFRIETSKGERYIVRTAPGGQDGRNQLYFLSRPAFDQTVEKNQGRDELQQVTVEKTSQKITFDGILNETDWTRATKLELTNSITGEAPLRKTEVRALWDEEALYLGFQAEDEDITEAYTHRDDPIYEHETLEIFLMPENNHQAPNQIQYVEIQISPGGVQFDASFTGPRKGMDKNYNPKIEFKTAFFGTLERIAPSVNQRTPSQAPKDRDQSFVSEWKIPWEELPILEKQAPMSLRVNLFRIEKSRILDPASNDLVWHSEYTAWSPPMVGDFHRITRFGRFIFAPTKPTGQETQKGKDKQ